MNVQDFFAHHGLKENPFAAEEARLDPIFDRLVHSGASHPDYPKILGRLDQPSTAVVFGEKGSGKTAIRLLMGQQIAEHNQAQPERSIMTVAYDDLNPVLDRLLRVKKQDVGTMLKEIRLEDHQDAILARAVSSIVGAIVGEPEPTEDAPLTLPSDTKKRLRKLSKSQRLDLATLAALYDQPRSGSVESRLGKLRKTLRIGGLTLGKLKWAGLIAVVLAAVFAVWKAVVAAADEPIWLIPVIAIFVALAVLSWGFWTWHWFKLWNASRKAVKDMPAVQRDADELRRLLAALPVGTVDKQPLPAPSRPGQELSDARYQLTRHLTDVLPELGQLGMVVFIDRMDEPTSIHGDADRMKAVTWPMFDNKFLKQDRIGLKLLLPIELSYMLKKEGPAFFQEARLDKQNLVERLTWSGATLYDLCTARLRAVSNGLRSTPTQDAAEPAGDIKLTDLFEKDVDRSMLIDALDQMHQPRDAFKFMYAVVQEHCRMVPGDEGDYDIARITLETVRRDQSQRVQELYRGLTPA